MGADFIMAGRAFVVAKKYFYDSYHSDFELWEWLNDEK